MSDKVLPNLEPQIVWSIFEEITKVPRPSKKEEKIRSWMKNWAKENKIASHILPEKGKYEIIDALREAGYEVILSIGELEENDIGSNCGQYVTNYLKQKEGAVAGYTYPLQHE